MGLDPITVQLVVRAAAVGTFLVNSGIFALCVWLVKRYIRNQDRARRELQNKVELNRAIAEWHGARLVQLETIEGIAEHIREIPLFWGSVVPSAKQD